MADQLNVSMRHAKRLYTGATRLKSLYNRGITFDILVRAGGTPTDFYCTNTEYSKFLCQLPELKEIDNHFTPVPPQTFFKKFIDNVNDNVNNK